MIFRESGEALVGNASADFAFQVAQLPIKLETLVVGVAFDNGLKFFGAVRNRVFALGAKLGVWSVDRRALGADAL